MVQNLKGGFEMIQYGYSWFAPMKKAEPEKKVWERIPIIFKKHGDYEKLVPVHTKEGLGLSNEEFDALQRGEAVERLMVWEDCGSIQSRKGQRFLNDGKEAPLANDMGFLAVEGVESPLEWDTKQISGGRTFGTTRYSLTPTGPSIVRK